jgi:hypothetical protein
MSHTRRIKVLPKKFINLDAGASAAQEFNSRCMQSVTDMALFKKVLQELKCATAGTVAGGSGGTGRPVDAKINASTGFVVSGDVPEIITADPDGAADGATLKRVASLYLFYQAKESLIRQGFAVSETRQDDTRRLVGEKIEEGETRVIEVFFKGDDSIDIESKNFGEAQQCRDVVEKITADIHSDYIEIDPDFDNCTYDFLEPSESQLPDEEKIDIIINHADKKHHSNTDRRQR